MKAEQMAQGITEADRARAELYDSLAQLRDRLDFAQRIDDSLGRARARITAEKREKPLLFIAGVTAVAAVGGLAVWAIAKKVIRAFD